jgi:hypothetical protein
MPQVSDLFGKKGMAALEKAKLPEPDRLLLKQNLEMLKSVGVQIKEAENQIDAVGLGRWGADAQRSVFTKSFYWLGQAGTVIDMQRCTATLLRVLYVPETIDTIKFINCEMVYVLASTSAGGLSIIFRSSRFDIFISSPHVGGGTTYQSFVYMYYCYASYATVTSALRLYLYNSTVPGSSATYALNSIMSAVGTSSYYCLGIGSTIGGVNCKYGNPGFNDSATGDYTLAPTSQCLYAGKNNAHIGSYGEALRIDPNNSAFAPGTATYSQTGGLDDIIKTSYDIGGVTYYQFVRRTGITSGNVRSGWISFGMVRQVDVVRMIQDVFFNANGGYSQCASDSLQRLRVGIYTALTEQEKAGAVIQWVDQDTPGIAVDALFISIHVFLTGDSPAT